MDPALAVLVTAPPVPAGTMLLLPGWAGPVPVPWTAIAAEARLRLCLDRPDLPAVQAVAAALQLGRADDAWRLVRIARTQPGGLAAAEGDLQRWAKTEAARLALPSNAAVVALTGDAERDQRLRQECGLAHRDLSELLAGIGYPGWFGQIVIAGPEVDLVGLGREARAERPAVPVLRLAPPIALDRAALDAWRAQAARALVQAHLAQLAGPTGGWPRWLTDGLAVVADAQVRGAGPSPRDAWEVRQAAGIDGLRRLLAGDGDQRLAGALVTAVILPHRRGVLPRLMELLRHGTPAEAAFRLAGAPLGSVIDGR